MVAHHTFKQKHWQAYLITTIVHEKLLAILYIYKNQQETKLNHSAHEQMVAH